MNTLWNKKHAIARITATAGLCLALTACGTGLDALTNTTDEGTDEGTDEEADGTEEADGAPRVCDAGTDLVFVTSMGSDSITTFSLNRADGTLTEAASHTYADVTESFAEVDAPVGGAPLHLTVNGAGTRLYVANSANKRNWDSWGTGYCSVSVFDINHDTGELSEIAGSPFFAYDDPTDHDSDDDGVDDYNDYCSNTSVIFNHDESVLMSIGGEQSDAILFHVDSTTGALEHYQTIDAQRGHQPVLHPTEDIFYWSYSIFSLDASSDNAATKATDYDMGYYYMDGVIGNWGGVDQLLAASGNSYIKVVDLTDPLDVTSTNVDIYRSTADGSGGSQDFVNYPRDIAMSADQSKFIITDMELSLVISYAIDGSDMSSFAPLGEISSLRQPRSLELSSDDAHLLVGSNENYTLNSVSVAEDGTMEVVDTKEVPGAYRSGIEVVPNQCD